MDLSRANLEFQIEELVLHGFVPGDRAAIGVAIQQELQRLFVERGVPRSLTQDLKVARLGGGMVQVESGMRADAVGVQIARSLYGGFEQSNFQANTSQANTSQANTSQASNFQANNAQLGGLRQ